MTLQELGYCFGLSGLQALKFKEAHYNHFLPLQPLKEVVTSLCKQEDTVKLTNLQALAVPQIRKPIQKPNSETKFRNQNQKPKSETKMTSKIQKPKSATKNQEPKSEPE